LKERPTTYNPSDVSVAATSNPTPPHPMILQVPDGSGTRNRMLDSVAQLVPTTVEVWAPPIFGAMTAPAKQPPERRIFDSIRTAGLSAKPEQMRPSREATVSTRTPSYYRSVGC
jgi:hypothetical protein